MPRRKNAGDEETTMTEGGGTRYPPFEVTWGEPTVTPEAHEPRRLVKLPGSEGPARTMYLVEDGVRYPIATSGVAAALKIRVEVVDEETLRQWPQGDLYTGA